MKRTLLLALLGVTLAACAGSLFKNKAAPPTMYMLGATRGAPAADPPGNNLADRSGGRCGRACARGSTPTGSRRFIRTGTWIISRMSAGAARSMKYYRTWRCSNFTPT